jgi:putative hydrolase of the HAD superfamily
MARWYFRFNAISKSLSYKSINKQKASIMILNNSKKFKSLPDAILFDTDNTLYSYEKAHTSALNAVADKAIKIFKISERDFYKAFYRARDKIKSRLFGSAASHSRLLYMQYMLENLGLGSQILIALDLEQTYWRTFLSNSELFNGVKDLLDEIRLLSIPTAIVTDLTAQIQFRKLVYFELDHHFDYVVTSEEAGFDKPHKIQFEIALEKIKPKGNRIWMIGDNALNDVEGAFKSIGAVTLQKIHKGVKKGTGNQKPDAYFNEFEDVRSLLQQISRST